MHTVAMSCGDVFSAEASRVRRTGRGFALATPLGEDTATLTVTAVFLVAG